MTNSARAKAVGSRGSVWSPSFSLPFTQGSSLQIYERKHFFLWKVFVHQHLEVFISVACNLSVDLVSTRPPFVYSWLKIFINDLVEFVPVCTWFGWLLHISFTCQSPLIYIPSLLLLPSKTAATELSPKSSYWINYSKMGQYIFSSLWIKTHSYCWSLT